MKIAMLIGTYYPIVAGAEVFAQKVAEHLVENGHEVDVITLRADSRLKKYELINGVTVYRVRGILKIPNLQSLSAIFPLAQKTLKLDKTKDYDLIHSHSPFYEGLAATFIKKLKGKKHLITVQGGGDVAEYKEYTGKVGGILKPLINWSLKNADMVHVVSTYLRDRVEKLGAKNTILIPDGVDLSMFKQMNKEKLREKYGYSREENIVISTSRLSPKNGMDCLIKTIPNILDKFSNVRLVLVGEGTQRKELERLIKKLKIGDKVHLVGYVPHIKITEYLNLADVFVRPSVVEGFGISFIEAMACKLPVIGSNVGSIPDIIEDGKNGFMVNPDGVDALSEKIKILLEDGELRKKFAEEGYKTVQEKFTWDIVLREMDKLYEKLI